MDEALILGSRVVVMTHRPGRIRESIDIHLERPRDTTTQAFNEIKRHVLELIREEAQLARQEAGPMA